MDISHWDCFSCIDVQLKYVVYMNRNILILLFTLAVCGFAYADESIEQLKVQSQKLEKQVDELDKESKKNQNKTIDLKKQVDKIERTANQYQEVTLDLKSQVRDVAASAEIQQQQLADLNAKFIALEKKQSDLIDSMAQLSWDTEQKTTSIDKTIMKRSTWYGAAMGLLILLLSGSYWYLRRRNDTSEKKLSVQVQKAIDTMRSTEEKIAKSDTDLADSLFEILSKLKVQQINTNASVVKQAKPAEPNHHLPLKLCDEIHRMRKRLASLPSDTKGLTPLQKSLERLVSELEDQGYEIVDHTGMAYSENLSVKARFIPSDELQPEQKVISKVVAPQVNYKNVMIRAAEIEVSIGS